DTVRARHRDRDPRRAQDRVEDVLRLPGEVVRRLAEHAGMPGLSWPSRRPARSEPARDRARDHRWALASLRDTSAHEARLQDLSLSRPAQGVPDLAIRPSAEREGMARALDRKD